MNELTEKELLDRSYSIFNHIAQYGDITDDIRYDINILANDIRKELVGTPLSSEDAYLAPINLLNVGDFH